MATARRQLIAIILLLVTFCASDLLAQSTSAKKKKASKDSGQKAFVVVDGAAIYEKANFDSPVMDYLERNKKVLISKKVHRGAGGLGAFYKIKVRKNVFGYIADVDVQVEGKGRPRDEDKPAAADDGIDPTQISSDIENPNPEEDPGGTGLMYTRYLGLGYSQINYSETIANSAKSSSTPMIALKMSGPGKVMGGMPLDLEFNFTTTAPDFYDKYFSSAKGFLFVAHAMTIIPFMEFKQSMFYYGIGLVAKYSKFDVVITNNPNKNPIDSQELSAGLGGNFGFAYAFGGGRYCARAEGKYYYEKEGYFGLGGALQMKF